ncbi:MAG: DNA-protecting protein DprA [Burkholderiales bacterium]|jgi:DNA processing protein|nr:DNA-protecting protein DprA [Burkholderiales bacterium]
MTQAPLVSRMESQDHDRERACWLALSQTPGLGIAGCWKRIRESGSAQAAWRQLQACADRASLQPSQVPRDLLEDSQRADVRIVTPVDPEYPDRLLDLHDPPLALHVRGTSCLREPPPDRKTVAIVGSRRATPYGISFAESLARDLARQGIRVVSGLARGVDAAAHRGSLRGGGPTLAILGCGLGVHYPREHRRLRQEIEACGAVVSEYPAHTGPDPWRFPARNRILAALADVVVVVQAACRSGALITADLASEIGRDVMAVPGPVGWAESEGCLQLLADGAAVVRSAEDVLDALGIHLSPAPKRTDLPDGTSGEVLAALGCEGARVDTLVDRTGRAPGLVAATLVRLEVEGRVRRLPEGIWVKL